MLVVEPRRVAVLIETDDTWGRSVVESIATFARTQPWRLLLAPRDAQHRLRLPAQWKGDGILVSMRDRAMAEHIRRAGLPAVDVSYMFPQATWLGRVTTDDQARAKMALDHFRQRGLKHFACYAPEIGRYAPHRATEFQRVVYEAGFECSTFPAPNHRNQGWNVDQQLVTQWLASLPKPLAVFAADPYPARQLSEICEASGIGVPDDVAILAGDEDDLLCKVSWPRLSSIQLASHRIGREAAVLLAELMNGATVPQSPLRLPPLQVHARHSSQVLAIDDPEVSAALRLIRERASQGIRVADIMRYLPVSRRSLEQKFRTLLGRSPGEELRRERLSQARALLLETDLSVSEIAKAAGYTDVSRLSAAMRKEFGVSPRAIRRQAK